jgi:hypothetical protein
MSASAISVATLRASAGGRPWLLSAASMKFRIASKLRIVELAWVFKITSPQKGPGAKALN